MLHRLNALIAVLVFAVLVVAGAVGVAPNVDTRLVQLGEAWWPGYAKDLRQDPVAPDCDLMALEAQAKACGPGSAAPSGSADPFAGDDPFADDAQAPPAAPPPAAPPADAFAGQDPFAEPGAAGGAPGDAFGGGDPFAEDGADTAGSDNCAAVLNLRDRCAARLSEHQQILSRITDENRRFRSIEVAVADVARFPWWKDLLVLLVVLGAIHATVERVHIALRDARTPSEHRANQGAQLLSHVLLLASALADHQVQRTSSAEQEAPELSIMWAAGFAALALVNAWHLLRPPASLTQERSTPARLAMVVPLYAWLTLISGAWFLLVEGHTSGQAIFLHKFAQIPSIYVGVGLYIWAGMIFSVTRTAGLAFGLLAPWKLPPALLAWLVVVLAALPTAYSGASGIFVLASGSVIFAELRRAGADHRLAVITTAMAGSLGVVLRPCLVVVLVATLNKEVTTDELFGRGLQVFALTSALFLAAMLWRNRGQGLRVAAPGEAVAGMVQAARPLVPYGVIAVVVVVVYDKVLGTGINEYTAPFVLPGILLALATYDRLLAPHRAGEQRALWQPLVKATSESSSHVGAILMLMTASVCLGGVVERADVMALMPAHLGSPVLTMTLLVFMMVLVGMTMDALGAVVLVSVSLATVAYDNGIDPVHFWMMVLVAFELGYLTPPVALNHLLARQVVGREALVEDIPVEGGVWARQEHVLLPMVVMGAALLVVAFVPFLWYPAG